MRLPRPLIALALGVGPSIVACEAAPLPPRGQVVVHVDTDAPVAPARSPIEPAPLFDRLRIELFAPRETEPCPDCRREVVASADLMRVGRFSFGFVPRPNVDGYRVRLVLFRSAGGLAPRPSSSLELVGALPPVGEEGLVELTAVLRTKDVGRPRGSLAAPVSLDSGAPGGSAVGTWALARVVDCRDVPPPGSVCVPGGAFVMGDPRVDVNEFQGGARERIAVVAPFFLDRAEVTVGAFRASGLARLGADGRSENPLDDSPLPDGRCDYTTSPGPNDALPVTCIGYDYAAAYCRARGGDLPTEAQFELVASRRGTRLAPWGDGDPTCDDAVVARGTARTAGGCGAFDTDLPPARVLPSKPGTGRRDRVALPGGEIVDLGGNLAEWTRDVFQRDDAPCWSAALLIDPLCTAEGPRTYSTKGGDLIATPTRFAQTRVGTTASLLERDIGFRCAYPALPRLVQGATRTYRPSQ